MIFLLGGVSIHFEGCSKDFMYFSFLSLWLYYPLVHGLVTTYL